ncbi:MAG: sigma factor-like helix-turn-helix DNA-binding protein [Ilumatobacteraceae bacterium]
MGVQIVTNGDDTVDGGFAAFYRDHRAGAVRLAWLLTHDAALGEDVVQDAFTAVCQRFDRVPAHRGRQPCPRAGTARRPPPASGRAQRRRCSIRRRRAERWARRPRRHAPRDERTAIVLHYWADLDHREIAAAMGIRPGTARSLLSSATARLRKVIEP